MNDESLRAKPTEQQLKWQKMEFGMFCHFGINTFFGKEWSDGTLPASGFNPTQLNTRQWVETAVEADVKYMIMTAKHHDGFCLWPTATTDYSVKSSPYKDGQGDVIKELSEACKELKMPLGLYLSPWDRHEPCYQDKHAYDDFYVRQLTELCTQYGELVEVWFDGAGSEGREYAWDKIMAVVDKYQPDAMVFNMGRPTIRWVGNEDGLAADPNFYVVDELSVSAFSAGLEHLRDSQVRYLPPECDVAIRRNWFWQPDDLVTLKTLDHLLAIYYRSIGYGANLLLNVPPDRTGQISPEDRERLLEFSQEVKNRFSDPVPANIEKTTTGFTLDFGHEVEFDHLCLQEDFSHGQFINGYKVFLDESSELLTEGVTVGHKKLHAFPTVKVSTLHVETDTSQAILSNAVVYKTGHSSIPVPAERIDYEKWAEKADKK